MPTIKLNAGKVVLKGGKPSCTCCDTCEQCDPDTITIDWEWRNTDEDPDEVYTGTATISLFANIATADDAADHGVPEGYCFAVASISFFYLRWDALSGNWSIDNVMGSQDPTTRCDPSGIYEEYSGAPITITISITP